MAYNQPRKPPPDARILRQRAADDKTNALREHIKARVCSLVTSISQGTHSCVQQASTIVGQYAQWENKTDSAIQRNVIQGRRAGRHDLLKCSALATLADPGVRCRFNKLQEDQDAALEARRRRYAPPVWSNSLAHAQRRGTRVDSYKQYPIARSRVVWLRNWTAMLSLMGLSFTLTQACRSPCLGGARLSDGACRQPNHARGATSKP